MAEQETAGQAQAWWLCPNGPRCPHGAIIHDVYELGDTPRCCVEGCGCGKRPDAREEALDEFMRSGTIELD